MSLEGDLRLPPRGPAKWRWLSSIIEKISRAANLISPNDSVVISDTPSGLNLRTPGQAAYDEASAWAAVQYGNELRVIGGDIEIDTIGTFTIPGIAFNAPTAFRVLTIRVDLALTAAGELLTPRAWEPLTEFTVSAVTMELVSRETLEAARSVLPGSRNSGTIYIAIATFTPFQQVMQYGYTPRLFLYHQYFTLA
jgi:hypothetical protein